MPRAPKCSGECCLAEGISASRMMQRVGLIETLTQAESAESGGGCGKK